MGKEWEIHIPQPNPPPPLLRLKLQHPAKNNQDRNPLDVKDRTVKKRKKERKKNKHHRREDLHYHHHSNRIIKVLLQTVGIHHHHPHFYRHPCRPEMKKGLIYRKKQFPWQIYQH